MNCHPSKWLELTNAKIQGVQDALVDQQPWDLLVRKTINGFKQRLEMSATSSSIMNAPR
jgi:hypothetical protein